MLLGLALSMVLTTSTPPPLKTIVNARSTPLCTALRTKIGPAIAAILQGDAEIDGSKPIFEQIYRDDVLVKSRARLDMDLLHLENLIGPIVQNLSEVQGLLDDKDLATLKEPSDQRYVNNIKDELQAVIKKQQAALNVINGFFDTEQMGEVQTTSVDNPAWESVFVAAPHSNTSRPSTLSYGANAMLRAGLHHTRAEGYLPEFTPATASLGFDPYKPFREEVVSIRAEEDPIESAAAANVNAASQACHSQSGSP